MPLLSALLAPLLLAQTGPFVTPGSGSASPYPPEVLQRQAMERQRRRDEQSSTPAPPVPAAASTVAASSTAPVGKLATCLASVTAQPDAAAKDAQAWLSKAKGAERAEAGECLGSALFALANFDEAGAAYLAARDAAAPADHATRARLGAMGGNAALAASDAAGALVSLDLARSDAGAAARPVLAAEIACDRARALVALQRDADAALALADARASDPRSAEAWLLSATLSRRQNKLADAQTQIEQAALLHPKDAGTDPEIGLEAGVIAVLAGQQAAARRSWQSVLAAAPESDAARTATGYLAQLDPATSQGPGR